MSRLNNRDLDRLTSELSSFARSDVPMPQGLAQLSDSLSSGELKVLAGQLATSTDQGQPLSEALTTASVTTPPPFIALVRCGEISGDMGGVLDFALKHGRMLRRHRSSMSTILVYPTLVLLVLVIVLSFVAMFVVPQFKDVYDMLGAELPFPTRVVVGFSSIMSSWGALLLLLLVGIGIYLLVVVLMDKLPARFLELMPGVSNLVYLSDTAIMSEFIGHLLSRGVPLPEACHAASLVVYNGNMRRSLEEMASEAERGAASAGKLSSRVPATAAWLYRQGEARGTLPETCSGIARYCESRFELLSRRTLYMMEPVLILVIALLVGFVVVSFYLPLFNIPKIVGR